jgi:peptidoglycan hydrolase-like amidase
MKSSACLRGRLVALLLLAAGCSAPATRATLPSARSAAPSTIRVGIREGNRITIRKVPLETYVQAAILSEFAPPSGDTGVVERMLEVQAVIGRTYALAHLGRHETEGFDEVGASVRRGGSTNDRDGSVVWRRAGGSTLPRGLRGANESSG